MPRSATEVIERVLAAAVLDSLAALKAASGGMPNAMLRDLQAIHANTTFADLPKEVQASVQASVRAAFRELQKEGYAVGPASAMPPRPDPPRGSPGPQGPRPHGRGPRPPHSRGGGGRPAPKGGEPRRGPRPKGR